MLQLVPLLLAFASTADAERLSFTEKTSSITMDLTASLHPIHGTANNFSGELDLGDEVTGSLTVQADALDTGLGLRDKRMRSYCLDTKRYPTITFDVRSASGDTDGLASGSGSGSITFNGSLNIRSSTRDVAIPMEYTWSGDTLKLTGTYEMQWADYGVPDPSIPLSKLYPDMSVTFDISATRAP